MAGVSKPVQAVIVKLLHMLMLWKAVFLYVSFFKALGYAEALPINELIEFAAKYNHLATRDNNDIAADYLTYKTAGMWMFIASGILFTLMLPLLYMSVRGYRNYLDFRGFRQFHEEYEQLRRNNAILVRDLEHEAVNRRRILDVELGQIITGHAIVTSQAVQVLADYCRLQELALIASTNEVNAIENANEITADNNQTGNNTVATGGSEELNHEVSLDLNKELPPAPVTPTGSFNTPKTGMTPNGSTPKLPISPFQVPASRAVPESPEPAVLTRASTFASGGRVSKKNDKSPKLPVDAFGYEMTPISRSTTSTSTGPIPMDDRYPNLRNHIVDEIAPRSRTTTSSSANQLPMEEKFPSLNITASGDMAPVSRTSTSKSSNHIKMNGSYPDMPTAMPPAARQASHRRRANYEEPEPFDDGVYQPVGHSRPPKNACVSRYHVPVTPSRRVPRADTTNNLV